MAGKSDKSPQLEMFKVSLTQFIKEDHELFLLSKKIDWDNWKIS